MRILNESRKVRHVEYWLVFYNEDKVSGFRFPCDKDGVPSNLSPLQLENYKICKDSQTPFLETEEVTYLTKALYQCDCGQEYYDECRYCANPLSKVI